MERPYKVKAGGFVGVMAVIMAGFMTLLYIVPASFSAALVWQEWIVVGAWILLGVFFYGYSKKKYGAEFGRDIFIVEETTETVEEEAPVALNRNRIDKHFVVTVGCEYGSGGPEIAKMVADYLGIEYYNRDLVDKVVKQIGVDKGLMEATKVQKEESELITEEFIHIMTRAMFESMFEVVRHKMPKEKAKKYLSMLERYHYGGWNAVMKITP